jgi:voltage-gated potassium channel
VSVTLPPQGTGRTRLSSVLLPRNERGPLLQVARRLIIALLALVAVILVVYFGREGYRDVNGDGISLLDAAYYATVSLSTTGYGDIAPFTPGARLVNVLLITPLRIIFLITLIGTTLEALTQTSREQFRQARWRATLKDHTVVVGFGTKGRSAIAALVDNGVDPSQIVVVDPRQDAIAEAAAAGIAGVVGDAARSEVLQRAEVGRAKRVIVAVQRDDTAVLVTLTARKLNPPCTVVVAVREAENAELLRQSGANSVVTSSDAAGRLLGLSTMSPSVGSVMEDLLLSGSGLEVAERVLHTREVGAALDQVSDLVLAVVRQGTVLRYNDPEIATLRQNDKLVFVRAVGDPHKVD